MCENNVRPFPNDYCADLFEQKILFYFIFEQTYNNALQILYQLYCTSPIPVTMNQFL